MKIVMKTVSNFGLILITVGSLAATSAWAQDASKKGPPKKERPAPTKEQREKMAAMHEEMASCLRSDQDPKECHEKMKKSCMEMGDECPMMGHHGKGPKMHKDEGESK